MELKPFKSARIMNFINLVEYSNNGVISKRIIDKTTGNITLFSFDQGQRLSEHTAPFDAMVQVLEGESKVSISKTAFNLIAGDSIIMPANVPHAIYATTRFKMLLTMIKGE